MATATGVSQATVDRMWRAMSLQPYLDGAFNRPRVRGDCQEGGCNEARPCPWIRCRWHLYTDVVADGKLRVNSDDPPEHCPHTCALDVAERGGLT